MKRKNNSPQISPEEAVEFIESLQKLIQDKDDPTLAISVRIPANILRSLKVTAKLQGKKYQSLLVEYLKEGLKKANQ